MTLTVLQRLIYYDTDPLGEKVTLTTSSLFATIHGAARGTLKYRNSENFVERVARVCGASNIISWSLSDWLS